MFWFKKNEYKRIIDSLTLDVSRLEEKCKELSYSTALKDIKYTELFNENLNLKLENDILRNKVLEKLGGEDDNKRKETS